MDRVVALAAIGLGSNLGDRHAHLAYARSRLETLLANLRFSSVRETDPVGVPGPQTRYLNAAAVGTTDASPEELLDALLAIEQERGRERPYPNAPRTLDLDLLLVGELVMAGERLVLPHPRMGCRAFVLEPLAEIAPRLRHPVTGQTIGEMLAACRRR
ncbi:MAG: 2-amino-4-hydroxy-6-hydroxymethyldihydropteridine diphosphokinase [Luteitalea sp.]|nr:2-amino-4-hydroxy-6-hydroxymethyldihydropteridine diphosphokinase [Luteitalea sp.]